MRVLFVATCLTLVALPALAQEAPLMPTPPPTDFTKPFQYDRAPFYDPGVRTPLPRAQDVALPVEVIGRAELIERGNPTMEELVRELAAIGLVQSQSARGRNAGGLGVSSLNLRGLGSGFQKIPPADGASTQITPVEVIRREDLLPQDGAFEPEMERASIDAENKRTPVFSPHCFFSFGEPIDLEARAISCRGTLTARTPNDPGP